MHSVTGVILKAVTTVGSEVDWKENMHLIIKIMFVMLKIMFLLLWTPKFGTNCVKFLCKTPCNQDLKSHPFSHIYHNSTAEIPIHTCLCK